MKQPTSLVFLQAVYLNEDLPLSVRTRAAIVSLVLAMIR